MMMKVDFIEIRLSKGLYYPSPAVTSGRSGGKLVFDCPILATEALWTSHEIFHEIFGLPSNTVLHGKLKLGPRSASWTLHDSGLDSWRSHEI
jgi:hypothetical protein